MYPIFFSTKPSNHHQACYLFCQISQFTQQIRLFQGFELPFHFFTQPLKNDLKNANMPNKSSRSQYLPDRCDGKSFPFALTIDFRVSAIFAPYSEPEGHGRNKVKIFPGSSCFLRPGTEASL